MKQQQLFVVLFLLLCISGTAISALSCSQPPFRYELGRSCDMKNYGLIGTLYISSPQRYTFTLSPNADYTVDTDGYYYTLSPNINYTIEWKSYDNSLCNGKNYAFTPNPHFAISQPKCRFSQGTVTFVKPEGLDFLDVSCENAPCNVTFANKASYEYSYEDLEVECDFTPAIYELTDSYPNLKVQDSYYYNKTGSIQLIDKSKYTNWILTYDEDDTPIPESTPSSATWVGLQTAYYFLTLESSTCGIQRIPIKIDYTWPNYYIEYGTNATCPRNASVKINFDDPNIWDSPAVQILIDGHLITKGKSFYLGDFQDSQSSLQFNYHSDTFYNPISHPSMIGDIQYTVDPCTRLVTLYYNETLYSDIYAMDDDGNQLVITDKTFTIPSIYSYPTIESPCFFTSKTIRISQPVRPIYKIVKPQQFCGDTMDVVVLNYYEFESLEMGDVQHDGQGLFKNVIPNNSVLNFKNNGCYEFDTFSIPTLAYTFDQVEEIIEIISYPSCNNNGNVSYTVKDVKNNILSEIRYFAFTPSQSLALSTQFSENCSQSFSTQWLAPAVRKYVNTFPGTISVIKNTTCKYSNDAQIEFETNFLSVTSIVINGVIYEPSFSDAVVRFNGIPYGTYQITISSSDCVDYYETISIGTDNDWEFPAIVSPVTGDCSIPNGGISFDSSILAPIDALQSSLIANNLPSGYQTISFQLKNGTCSGSVNIFVPTASDSYATSKIYSQPSCSENHDGYVKFSVNDKNGNEFAPTGVELNSNSFTGNIFNLGEGSYNFIVKNSSCAWPVSVSMKAIEPEFTFKKIVDTFEKCEQKTFVSITPSSHNIYVDAITSGYSPLLQYSNNVYAYYPQTFSNTRQIFITYNQVCVKALRVEETTDLSGTIEWPTVTVPSVDCTDPSVQNSLAQVINPTNMMLYAGGFSVDHMYVPKYNFMSLFGFTANDKKSGCQKTFNLNTYNQGIVAKTITKSTCPGSIDGKIQIDVDPNSNMYNVYQVMDYGFDFLPVTSGSKLNSFSNITNIEYNLVRSFRNNPFCSVVENVNIVVDEPFVSLSSTGLCDASDTPIGDVGVVTNTLSITTTNVTYNLNGHFSTNPVFKGLSAGDYSSTVTIYNSVCRRVIQSNSVSVAKLPSVSVNVDVSTCMKAVINPTTNNIQHKYTIRDSTDKVVLESTSIGSFTFTPTSQDTYSVIASDV
ncbi:hypothetical protein CYY_010231, partial [Polysphondylium violaceum]